MIKSGIDSIINILRKTDFDDILQKVLDEMSVNYTCSCFVVDQTNELIKSSAYNEVNYVDIISDIDKSRIKIEGHLYVVISNELMFSNRFLGRLIVLCKSLSNNDIKNLEYLSTLLSSVLYIYDKESYEYSMSRRDNIKSCYQSLTPSEKIAFDYIKYELKNDSKIIVSSTLSKKYSITRSVIVNTLKKMESAKIIETRSLGMKGTFVNILNEFIKE